MLWCGVVFEQVNTVGRRVMQARQKYGVFCQRYAVAGQTRPGFGVVQQLRQKPRRHFAGLPRASTAVIGAFMRIVGHLPAMAQQQHQPRVVGGHAHRLEDSGPGRGLGLGRQATLDARRRFRGQFGKRQGQRVAHQFHCICRSCRLDKGKGRHRCLPEPAPSAGGAGGNAGGAFDFGGGMAGRGHAGVQQHGQMHLQFLGAMRTVLQRQPEKACETNRFNAGVLALHRAAEHLGTHVDAECRLQRRAASTWLCTG